MKPPPDIDPADSHAIDADTVALAARAISAGGIVLFPTHDLYGLGADPFNVAAVERIFAIKQRPAHQPILVLIDAEQRLLEFAANVSPVAKRIIDRFWPGNVTIVCDGVAALPTVLTGHTGKIGIRQAGHSIARALSQAAGGAITGTSANLSGQPGVADIRHLPDSFIDQIDFVLDGGALAGGPGSTLVDVTCRPLKVLRQGRVPAHALLQCQD